VNGPSAVNGFTVMNACSEAAPVITDTDPDSSASVDSGHKLADSQLPSSTDLVTCDLHIRSQTLLWKAQPKPPYNNQVFFSFIALICFPVCLSEDWLFCAILFCSLLLFIT